MSPCSFAGLRVRRRHVLLEEAEVGDVPITLDQPLAVEHVARKNEQLVANARFRGDVVADDVDAIDDGRRAFIDLPAEIDRRTESLPDLPAFDDRTDARVDVALVLVGLLHLARRRVPGAGVEDVLRLSAARGRRSPSPSRSTLFVFSP